MTTTFEFVTKKRCIFEVAKFNSKHGNILKHVFRSYPMSEECDEERRGKGKCLDFRDTDKVEHTFIEYKKGTMN